MKLFVSLQNMSYEIAFSPPTGPFLLIYCDHVRPHSGLLVRTEQLMNLVALSQSLTAKE